MNYSNLCTWAEIDIDALKNNFDVLSSFLPASSKKLAVIKADAYGHGALYVAKALENVADFFGVARADEGLELRNNGLNNRILILGYTPVSYYKTIIENRLTPTVYRREDAELLNAVCSEFGCVLPIHIAVDTGMSRIGFDLSDKSAFDIEYIASLKNIHIEGIFSHLANADDLNDCSFTQLQTERFNSFVDKLSDKGISIEIKHLYNSAGICSLNGDFGMSRMGICLYGHLPDVDFGVKGAEKLTSVMSLRSQVIHVHEIEAGTPVSYNCTFTAAKRMRIATVCAGYADGFPRLLSNKGRVLINGQYADIIGRICMDQFICDITDIDDVAVGSVVTLFGKDGENIISPVETAKHAETNVYEILCGISKRVPRVYFTNGEPAEVHYGISHNSADD